ncbi:cytoplasmic 60S subunit biogenesis factor REI1 homolog 1 isoform X1 [Amborella trichopoda]|uniref:C2H2-type domain-containing protein n=1 Tax=Amborella trichopoda TaxID=13333 RepID=W1PI69_AMBTC|nr:cytoplasmic 60S subunit biogenesis factor REI1 homolog 1 isoform X1 [Amborella trichopoda]XP_011623841.1 cytoplasmic 60S subunit biogenesis factor REI1 homolog 1 isoform X1 [Amborella trichopoda]ERN07326.1 hypothetical protein AMTR_s00019p00227240 [Amborella trichopoda]|eukprot:XP_006845651.1 cytoplasmic 60S subunit biogenesis factor REI1 homolog 1 isoform X1 [Amborella trichopoda]
MPAFTCNACNTEFEDDAQQKIHYKSEWHRYNLKRKVAGIPGVTEALFQARLSALADERTRLDQTRMIYSCALCGKEYRSSKAHAEHLKSRSHAKASQTTNATVSGITVIRPLPDRGSNKSSPLNGEQDMDEETEESEEEWEEIDPNEVEEVTQSLESFDVTDSGDGEIGDWDPSRCFICDLNPDKTVESCVEHMHKAHGFYIPDAEYLKDPQGLLKYVGLKVTRDFMCLYCDERRQPFLSLEAVRKHMISKSHCKLPYGEGGDEEDTELEEFYDYSSSFPKGSDNQVVALDESHGNIELGYGGAELVITRKTENGNSSKALGSREFLRYYRQKPRPTSERDAALARALVSRYQNMGVVTVQSKERVLRMKVLKEMHRSGVEALRTRVGMKNNVIRNLPKNVPY